MAVNLASGLIQDLAKRAQLLGNLTSKEQFDPSNRMGRKDHTTLRVRLSGHEVLVSRASWTPMRSSLRSHQTAPVGGSSA